MTGVTGHQSYCHPEGVTGHQTPLPPPTQHPHPPLPVPRKAAAPPQEATGVPGKAALLKSWGGGDAGTAANCWCCCGGGCPAPNITGAGGCSHVAAVAAAVAGPAPRPKLRPGLERAGKGAEAAAAEAEPGVVPVRGEDPAAANVGVEGAGGTLPNTTWGNARMGLPAAAAEEEDDEEACCGAPIPEPPELGPAMALARRGASTGMPAVRCDEVQSSAGWGNMVSSRAG